MNYTDSVLRSREQLGGFELCFHRCWSSEFLLSLRVASHLSTNSIDARLLVCSSTCTGKSVVGREFSRNFTFRGNV